MTSRYSNSARVALLVVAVVTILRIVVAARVPLTEDEAYYWTWSRHLAFGYLDHPPLVAWLIAAGSIFGQTPLAVRMPFILCEALTALAAGRAALLLSGDIRAATAATIIVTLIPQPRLMIGEALPDGPYLLCWALTLWLTLRVMEKPTPVRVVQLGLALGGAILSRWFGWVLVAGVALYACSPQRRALGSKGVWFALVVALLTFVPFLAWNATHGWANVVFTFHGRAAIHTFSAQTMLGFSTLRTVLFAVAFLAIAYYTLVRPGYDLLAWTALPFALFLLALSPFETVESYWLLGPFISLCIGIGIWYARASTVWKHAVAGVWIGCALYTVAAASFSALPENAQSALLRASNGDLKAPLYSSTSVWETLTNDVDKLARSHSALILTDRYEIASELNYHDVDSLVVGPVPQAAPWRAWHTRDPASKRALIVTFDPLSRMNDLFKRGIYVCRTMRRGAMLTYTYAGTSAATFYTTWCNTANGSGV